MLAGLLLQAGAARKPLRLSKNEWPASGVRPWLSNMPPMSSSHSPKSAHWTNSIALCAISKDEEVTDVIEWLLYYQCAPRLALCAEHMA